MDAITDRLFLPPKEELDKLLRDEALINRQLNHTIGELERLQTRRKEGSTRPMLVILQNKANKPFSFNGPVARIGKTKPNGCGDEGSRNRSSSRNASKHGVPREGAMSPTKPGG
jgi:hypothetical protein